MNAAMMEVQAKVAVRINIGPERVIGKDEIAGVIKKVMEGKDEIAGVIKRVMEGEEAKRMRNRVREMKDKAMYALSKDGCSTSALAQVTHVWISTAVPGNVLDKDRSLDLTQIHAS
uniref:Uncharacterized protein n=1 Tax=Leersia perrieri TaxID=77586 RepID=A0A0D9WDW8_9ORYZ